MCQIDGALAARCGSLASIGLPVAVFDPATTQLLLASRPSVTATQERRHPAGWPVGVLPPESGRQDAARPAAWKAALRNRGGDSGLCEMTIPPGGRSFCRDFASPPRYRTFPPVAGGQEAPRSSGR